MAVKSLLCAGGRMKPKICIEIRDGWADIYAFATLYEFLIKNNFEADFKVSPSGGKRGADFKNFVERMVGVDTRLEVLPNYTAHYHPEKFDIIFKSYSDLPLTLVSNELAIDLSILKNCVKSSSKEERMELRKKHNVPLEEKVIVLGFPGHCVYDVSLLRKVISELFFEAKMYLVGTTNFPKYLPEEAYSLVKNVYSRSGLLRDYYALADVSLIHKNIGESDDSLHNFVEATAGGPLFLVKPQNSTQYGYKQLVQRRVIQEAENTEHLIKKVKQYLQNPEEEYIREQRKQHLEKSRELYLTDLMRLLNKLLRISDEPLQSDLQFISDMYSPSRKKIYLDRLRIIHPRTVWSMSDYESERHTLKSLNSKSLDDKCFRRSAE